MTRRSLEAQRAGDQPVARETLDPHHGVAAQPLEGTDPVEIAVLLILGHKGSTVHVGQCITSVELDHAAA
ncbi:MAG: hypothetical protein DRI90_08475 [Deltaproteobacteria bacterium]|nr:MAG: hypothetical protein DRI90_08475 [Deltaproteobacteria bacterium]